MLEFDGDILLVLDSAAGTGSSPTLDIKLTNSDASSGTYTDLSGATSGNVRVIALQDVDFAVKQAGAFCFGT